MGYTHYFVRKPHTGTPAQFITLALDAQRIIDAAEAQGITICDWKGEGKPEFTEAYFSLNGSRMNDESCETFLWDAVAELGDWEIEAGRTVCFSFTKTNYKPYDAVVTAILIRAAVIYGDDVEISSDGLWSDWVSGRTLYAETFGEYAPRPFPDNVPV